MAASSSSSSGEQQYSLRWNDFHSSILSTFRNLRDEEDFVDVTLACDSSSFTAHKVVLSACSPYFRRLLKANPCQHPIVILRDVASADMESILRFMYHGEVHVGQERLPTFLQTAQMLQVRGLADVNSSAATAKIPSLSSSTGNNGSAPATPRNTWQDNGRGDPNESGLNSPPEKRPRSYTPPLANHVEHRSDQQESLLGQALEGGPTIHTTPTNNVQAQSTGEDSNSLSDNEEEMSNNDSILNSVKAEPSDILSDAAEHHRHTFPTALLGLQGLMPGPSGIHTSQDANYDHGLDEAEGTAYHHHHSHHQQLHHHRPLSVSPPHHHLDEEPALIEEEDPLSTQSYTTTTTTATIATKYQRSRVDFRQQRLMREHHRQHGYKCPLCVRTLHDISVMRTHLDHHFPRDSHICPVASCAKSFSHPNSVRNHMRLKHPVQWDQIKTLRWAYV